ncbi:hypothetical protein LCGC14_3018900, partial [marine sediment metagenome]
GQYGDKTKQQEQKAGAPIQGAKPGPEAKPRPPVQPAQNPEGEPVGIQGMAPHNQVHIAAANFFMKKANESRPRSGNLSEGQSAKLMAAQIALDLAEQTGSQEMAELHIEIMNSEEDDDPWNFFANLAAAKMDDIDIAEGRYQENGISGRSGEKPSGAVQAESEQRDSETKTETGEPKRPDIQEPDRQ